MRGSNILLLVVLLLVVVACGGGQQAPASGDQFIVTDGTLEKTYTSTDLKALPASEAEFNGVAYRGVVLSVLLEDAGFDPNVLAEVKPVASDGYSMKYGPEIFLLEDSLLAYERVNGPLASDEVPFRMVLPTQEGKMNVRQVIKIEVKP